MIEEVKASLANELKHLADLKSERDYCRLDFDRCVHIHIDSSQCPSCEWNKYEIKDLNEAIMDSESMIKDYREMIAELDVERKVAAVNTFGAMALIAIGSLIGVILGLYMPMEWLEILR